MTVYKWSQTAASNSNSDATINWVEGQAPSTVNDSARSMMAAIAKWRDDLAATGLSQTGGTATAYTRTTSQAFDSLVNLDNKCISFIPHVTNGAGATLNVDTLGAKPIWTDISGTVVAAGTLRIGRIYHVTYFNGVNAFTLHDTGAGFLDAPATTRMSFQQTTPPIAWTKESSATYNDATPRLITGSITTGGSVAFATLFGRTGTDAVTISQANLPNVAFNGSCSVSVSVSGTTGNANQSLDHTHPTGVVAVFPQGTINNGAIFYSSSGGTTGFASGAGYDLTSHTHSFSASGGGSGSASVSSGGSGTSFTPAIDMRVKFADFVIGIKD